MPGVTIGKAADRCGVKVPTIRYYEAIGLLAAPARSDGNRRTYADADLQRLSFIRHARDLGFEVEAIRTLLALQDDPRQTCEAADTVARKHLASVERRIANLTALKQELLTMIEGCRRGRVETCRVIEVLADHDLCASKTHR